VLTVATVVLDEVHVDCRLQSFFEPSLIVQVAMKAGEAPTRTLGDAGVTAIDESTALQVSVVVPATLVAGSVAVMVTLPALRQAQVEL
jgi:hypothetical protein